MPNKENIEPYTLDKRNKQAARKIQKKGGKARGKQQTQQKTFKELAQQILKMKAPKNIELSKDYYVNIRKKIKDCFPDIKEKEITNKIASLFALQKEAFKGDVRAFEALRDTAGEKPDGLLSDETIDKITIEIVKSGKK